MTTSKAASSTSIAAPAASAISALEGLLRARPSGRSITGSVHVGTRRLEQLASLIGVGEAEGVRDRAALEDLPQLVGPARPLLADDVDRVGDQAPLGRPLEQEAGDRLVEHLVGGGRRPRDVVVDPPEGDRVEDRLGARRIRPGAPGDHQPPLRVRMQLARPLEQLTAGRIRERPAGEHERHVLAVARQVRQPAERPLGIAQALDPVVVRVALDELRLELCEDVRVLFDDEQDGGSHSAHPTLAATAPNPDDLGGAAPPAVAVVAGALVRDRGLVRGS